MGWDYLVISGDLTQLALPEEFAKARMALRPLLQNQEELALFLGIMITTLAKPRNQTISSATLEVFWQK